ncbi:MAG TPA: hypothetical protein VF407_17235 [Polyangiaceae bacterium]
MHPLHDVAYFFGGLFLANAVPHWVTGLQGRPFQSPFAKPPGEGLSSSRLNVLWGAFNVLVAWLLIEHVGTFDGKSFEDAGAVFVGALVISERMSKHFGRFHGGNTPV